MKARGFLLEDGLILSDNSHHYDAKYLNELLTDQNIGEVKDDTIIIFPNRNVEKIFYSEIQYGSESFLDRSVDWAEFLHNKYVPKVYIGLLEKFIARYVKAISACGVQTHGSCDGNHQRFNERGRLKIEISSVGSEVWHKILCERLLVNRFNLRWNNKFDEISFNKINKWTTYVELNRAAEFLYTHRIEIRRIKCEASDKIDNEMSYRKINNMPDIAEKFSEEVNKIFDEILI